MFNCRDKFMSFIQSNSHVHCTNGVYVPSLWLILACLSSYRSYGKHFFDQSKRAHTVHAYRPVVSLSRQCVIPLPDWIRQNRNLLIQDCSPMKCPKISFKCYTQIKHTGSTH